MSGRVNGVVKFFAEKKGYGFITRDDGEGDVFLHVSEVTRAGVQDIGEGDKVSFEVRDGKAGKGKRAVDLRVV